MKEAAQHKPTMRINEDTVIEETCRAGVFRRRRLNNTEKGVGDGVIGPALYEAAVSFWLVVRSGATP